MHSLLRRCIAEALGAFGLVFIGAGVILANVFPGGNSGLLGTAFANAMVLSVLVTATVNISGAHLNPAVTLGFLVTRRMPPRDAGAYVAAQLIGAVLGALLLTAIFPDHVARGSAYGTPLVHSTITTGKAILLEAVLAFFLVSAYWGTVVNPEAPKVGGFGIGVVMLFAVLVGGPLTGAALNPARAFGPALISGTWTGHAIYWVGPILGGLAAAVLWEKVLLPKHTPA